MIQMSRLSRLSRSLNLVIICMLIAACSYFQNQEAAYLDSAKGWAGQAQVREKPGAPKAIQQPADGTTVWIYELREQQPGNRLTTPGMWCEQYLLTFDDKAVLQKWRQVSHFHGGELMPQECMPGTEPGKS